MLKRWISILVMITMLGSVFGVPAFADEETLIQSEPQITEQPITPEPVQQDSSANGAGENAADVGNAANAPASTE